MKTKEELLAMSHEDLAEYAIEKQNAAMVAEYLQNARVKEILAAIGIAYETYKREVI